MIRRHAAIFRAVLMLADALLTAAVTAVLSVIRFGSATASGGLASSIRNPALALVLFSAGWVFVLWIHGMYRPRARWTFAGELGQVVRSTFVMAIGTLAALFLFKLPDVSRLLLIWLFPSLALTALITRTGLRIVLTTLRERGRNTRFMLMIGASARATAFADVVEAHHELGLVVLGHIRGGPDEIGAAPHRTILGSLDDLESVLHENIVDEVAICLPFSMAEQIDAIVRLCEEEGRIVRIPVAVAERAIAAGHLEEIDGIPVYSLVNGPDRMLGLLAKRVLDAVAAVLLLVVLFPLFVLIAFLIRLDSPGPVHFRQTRVGVRGRLFEVVKFRTMREGAEAELEVLLAHNEIDGHAFKITNDPRVTRIGRFLRRTSLDELPQLWNVLRGQMSLVGPRPPLPREVAGYDVWHRRRLSMKPGITGLWQISARHEVEFNRWVETDLEYIDRWSFWLDLQILLRTVPVVILGQGR